MSRFSRPAIDIREVAMHALDWEVVGIRRGFAGLIDGDIMPRTTAGELGVLIGLRIGAKVATTLAEVVANAKPLDLHLL